MDMMSEIGRWLQEEEILPRVLEQLGVADSFREIIMISLGVIVLLGILSAFFGLRLVRFWSFLIAFVTGTGIAAGAAFYFMENERISAIIGLGVGLILAIVFAVLKRAGVFLTALVFGTMMSAYWIRLADWIWLLLCAGIGLLCALLTIKLSVPVLILLTGVAGAGCISWAGANLLENVGIKLEDWVITLIVVILAVLGVLVQFLMESRRRQKLHLKKAAEIREKNSTENEVDKARALLDEEIQEEDFDEEEDLSVSEEIITDCDEFDEDMDEDIEEDIEEDLDGEMDEFWDDEDDDVEILEIDLSDEDDEV